MIKRPHKTAPIDYRLEIMATDHGVPPKYTTKFVTVEVPQSNHKGPRFTQSRYEGVVQENGVKGFVMKLEAENKDGSELF